MSNLRHLVVETTGMIIDGRQWEHIITTYLPSLKDFRFEMQTRELEIPSEFSNLLDSYRSQFWLVERKWFVRYHVYENVNLDDPSYNFTELYLYTLPYGFTEFRFERWHLSESTCPSHESYYSYDRVNSLFNPT